MTRTAVLALTLVGFAQYGTSDTHGKPTTVRVKTTRRSETERTIEAPPRR